MNSKRDGCVCFGLDKRTPLISGVQLTDATIAGDKPRSSIMLDGV